MLDHRHAELQDAEYVVFTDSARHYVDCSDGASRLVGYSREEFLQLSIEDVSFHEEEVSRLFAEYLKRGQMTGEYVLRHKSGTPIPIQFRAFVFPDGCAAAIWEPIRDWRELYLAALVEVDPQELKSKLESALTAVQRRIRELTGVPSRPDNERQALRDAASALQTLLRSA